MSDIFEIKTSKIEIKIKGKTFDIVDPKFSAKVMMKKDWDGLAKSKETMEESDYMMAAYDLNKKTIKSFIPEMSDDFIDNEIPSSALELLIGKISEISADKFGAVIEKAEKKQAGRTNS